MELLLNFFWLLLTLPACWLWRRGASVSQAGGQFRSRRVLLILGCAVLLLFPVVSATDDLHAMRRDMEEPSTGKQTVNGGRSHRGGTGSPHQPLAHPSPAVVVPAHDQLCGLAVVDAPYLSLAAFSIIRTGRAPPLSFLG
ncbi:MAG: hypothetical protein LAN83_14205 [Acidobacteriia bacterium]|nr:hypothetical protein [Terriglobia bacterium]